MKDAGTPVRDDPMQTDDKANTPDKGNMHKGDERNALYLRLTIAPVQEEEAAPSSPATTSTTPGKTKRKVLKKKQYTNERGFMGK